MAPGSTIRGEPDEREHPAPTARLGVGYTCFDTLGSGGTAVVRRAHQSVLDREVAIKTPLRGANSPAMVARVLQEAWVTGALEHPGVVPVHDVVVDDDGCPHIVMRRIAGWTWTELINQPELVQGAFGARDVLEWHLRALMAVAATVHHAHGRGVLHRDLKPDNVMIGASGETYVLDWGIAVALDDRAAHRLPRAAEQSSLAGTPHFMAPEMARADGAALGPHTDVYLLGGLLFAILSCSVPHPGDDMQAVVDSAASVLPRTPPGPTRLAELCAATLSLAPEDRPGSAEGFRRAIQGYLEERGADALVEAGREALDALVRTSPTPANPSVADPAPALFAAARLAFEQALARSPGHAGAAEGLRRARLVMVEHELSRGAPEAAARVLAELPDPPNELAAAVGTALAAAARRAAESGRLLADHDLSAGVRTRAFVSLILGTIFIAGPLYTALFNRQASLFEVGVSVGLLQLAVVGVWFWARDSLGRTMLNRAFIRTTAAAPFMELLLIVSAERLGLTITQVLALFPLVLGSLSLGLAATVEPWMLTAALTYFAAFVTVAYAPAMTWHVLTFANVVLATVALYRWGPEGFRSWLAFRREKALRRHGERKES